MITVYFKEGDYIFHDSEKYGKLSEKRVNARQNISDIIRELTTIAKNAGFEWEPPIDKEFPLEYFGFTKYVFDYGTYGGDCHVVAYEQGNHSIRIVELGHPLYTHKVEVVKEGHPINKKWFDTEEKAKEHLMKWLQKYSVKSLM